jgi:hypothetical protein
VRSEIDRAYATLGLPPDAALEEVRRQYKALVRRWHPDRFTSDPRNQAHAAEQMRAINAAYHAIQSLRAPEVPVEAPPPAPEPSRPTPPRPAPPAPGARLSREQIDDLVRAIGTEGPLDVMFASMRSYSGVLRRILVYAALGWAAVLTMDAVFHRNFRVFLLYPDLVLLLLLVAGALGTRRFGK